MEYPKTRSHISELFIPQITTSKTVEHATHLALINTTKTKYITAIRSWTSLGDLLLAPGELDARHHLCRDATPGLFAATDCTESRWL